MIRDLSETLRAILDDPALAESLPELAAALITFDRPSENFNPAQATVDLFLYDVRENMELRSNEPVVERHNGLARIHRPPLRVDCSYLVTAWPVGGAELTLQEHRLLSQALLVLSRHPTVPAKFLKGKLAGQAPPLPMITAQADGLKNPSEFWTALGNKLRPSLSVTVTISMQAVQAEEARVVTASQVRLGERASIFEKKIKAATQQVFFRIGGQVTDDSDAPVAGATVSIQALGLEAVTTAEGFYSLGVMPPGDYALRVQSGSVKKDVSISVPAPAGKNFNVKLTG